MKSFLYFYHIPKGTKTGGAAVTLGVACCSLENGVGQDDEMRILQLIRVFSSYVRG